MTQKEGVKLPRGWARISLKDIISLSSGKNLTKAKMVEGEIPVFGGNGVTGWHNDKNISKPTLIIGRVGFYCGSVYLSPEAAWVTDNAFITEFSAEHIDIHYLYWLLKFTDLRQNVSSSAQPVISGQKVYPIEVTLPPLPEQKRIVEKLDSVLAQVDTIQQRLNNLPDIIKRFRQSVLAAAVSGKLTEQWRGKSNIANPEKSCLNSLGRVYGGKTPSKSNSRFWEEGSIPWVSPKDMKVYEISSSQDFITDLALTDGGMNLVPKGSILMVTRSGILAHTFPVAITMCNLTINQDIKAFTPNRDKISSEFAGILMKGLSHRVLDECSKVGTTVSSVETDKLVTLKFNLPNPQEQTEIVRLVEQYFALADTLEKNLANAKQRVDNLTQSILAKAFRGELVPQDPNDEPADKLLARIKAARLEAEKLEKAAKKAAKASKQ